jgi:hypothetical protein
VKARAIILVSLVAGGGDFVTGTMLAGVPSQALALMRVPPVRELVWLQYIGVFVACIGFSYLAGLFSWWRSGSPERLQTVWELTAVFRAAVGTFVGVQVFLGHLPSGWSVVVATDWFWALLQAFLLRGAFFEI